jgi:ABC-2 type transport system permease protein
VRNIAVFDGSTIVLGQLESSDYTKFTFIPKEEYDKIKDNLKGTEYYALLVVQPNVLNSKTVELISESNIPFDLRNQVQNKIKAVIEKEKMAEVIRQTAVPDLESRIAATKTAISVNTIKLGESGEAKKSSTELGMVLGYVFGLIIYMFILLYGQMVMQGVMEEKQSRIVEVIISSVKPFELMMGKIIGIAMVGLTQLAIWIVLGIAIIGAAQKMMPGVQPAGTAQEIMAQSQIASQADTPAELGKIQEILSTLDSVNFPLIIGCFIFFFIGGYLIYSSLFAAVGAAVDATEDAQQFMMPIMMPIILAILVMASAISNPEGATAFWFSMIPFTSPIVMMARIPFGVPAWQLALSMFILVITFVGMVWAAGKIYRTGILMYGKKASWKELAKWLTYRS